MYTVRPILPHFIIWVMLAPLFLLEAYALDQFLQTLALQDSLRVRRALAVVTAERAGPLGPEVRYAFQAGGLERIGPMNPAGWGEPWVPISDEAWAQAQRRGGLLEVVYLPERPQANQPVGRVGYPLGDSFCGWGLFLIVDLLWLAESFVIVRNFLRAQTAAERRAPLRVRFWEARPLLTPLERQIRRVEAASPPARGRAARSLSSYRGK